MSSLVALTARLRRCSDSVSYMMYFCRAGEATTMSGPCFAMGQVLPTSFGWRILKARNRANFP
jgi:hypothetical protein